MLGFRRGQLWKWTWSKCQGQYLKFPTRSKKSRLICIYVDKSRRK